MPNASSISTSFLIRFRNSAAFSKPSCLAASSIYITQLLRQPRDILDRNITVLRFHDYNSDAGRTSSLSPSIFSKSRRLAVMTV